MTIHDMLARNLDKESLILGVGNRLFGDDAFGPAVIDGLRDRTSLALLNGGIAPENLFGPISRLAPTRVIIADAVSLNAPFGSLHWLEPDELDGAAISTHGPPLDLVVAIITQYIKARVHIIGVVPATLGLNQAMSPEVQKATQTVVASIADLFPADPSVIQSLDSDPISHRTHRRTEPK